MKGEGMAIGECRVCGSWVDESDYNWELESCIECACECERDIINDECTECGVGICENCAEEYGGKCVDCFKGKE